MRFCKEKARFQAAFSICSLFTLAPHAGAGTFFSLLRQRKESKRKATAGTGLAPPNFPLSARFFGRARNLRLRRFKHASPYFPKNRAPFGGASRTGTTSTVFSPYFAFDFTKSEFPASLVLKFSGSL
ncbi:hypothetical protein EIKCOROL_00636 [Eikenella corrodens ATCC 23834]|uniref:Uncharacterized protein n=1 Tax=Eikenella corrodens ATCC 23834 TaxID=546274 RepID=C0DTF8_EIKCO|nr:hypothetical protein EIKCOROL_00636 [Eikenella corrodens ATCC 23834]